jgi:hypothetical protein
VSDQDVTSPPFGTGFLPVLAVWAGILAAGLELGSLLVRRLVLDQLVFVGSDVWWTVPLVDVLLFLLVAAGLMVFRLAWRSGPWWQVELWVLAFLALIGVLYSLPGLHRIAVLLVAAGVATQVVRIARGKPQRFHRLVLRSYPWLLFAAVMVGTVVRGGEIVREKRALAALPVAGANTPNILLIVLDTVRAMDLGLYGYGRPTTPELNEWAMRGVVYRRAFSTAPWTLPSHASMCTGRLVHEMSADWMVPLDDQWPTLAEVLARKGMLPRGSPPIRTTSARKWDWRGGSPTSTTIR